MYLVDKYVGLLACHLDKNQLLLCSYREQLGVEKIFKSIMALLLQIFIVKLQFEVYKYFLLFVHCLKYLMCCFAASVQLVP